MQAKLRLVRTKLPDLTDTLHQEWQRLGESIGANYTLYPGWTIAVAESRSILQQTDLLSAYDGAKLVALLPLVTSRIRSLGISLRRLDLVANHVSYHHRPLTSLEPERTMDLLLEAATTVHADMLCLGQIPDESDMGTYLRTETDGRYIICPFPSEASPYLPLDGTWESLLASKPKKFRYKVRKRAELFESSSDFRMKWFRTVDDCDSLLECIQSVEEHSWKKAAGHSIFDSRYERLYHELVLPFLASNNAMFANVLFRQESPIAFNLCCIWKGWVGQMKTSFDTRFAELSPGSLVIDHAIRHAIELGATEFDFLGDADAHKVSWTKNTRAHQTFYLYLKNSRKGRILGRLKRLRTLVPNRP